VFACLGACRSPIPGTAGEEGDAGVIPEGSGAGASGAGTGGAGPGGAPGSGGVGGSGVGGSGVGAGSTGTAGSAGSAGSGAAGAGAGGTAGAGPGGSGGSAAGGASQGGQGGLGGARDASVDAPSRGGSSGTGGTPSAGGTGGTAPRDAPADVTPPLAVDASLPPGPGGPCGRTSDCPTEHACLSGRCTPSRGLAAFYDLEQAGPQITDGSGNGTHGTAVQATRVAGKLGSAYRFTTGSCIRVPDSPSLSLAGVAGLTAMAWVSHPGTCSFDRGLIVNKESSYEVGLECASGAIQAALNTTTTTWSWFGTRAVPAGTWHHVAVTWDGAAERHYLDGTLVEMRPLSGTFLDTALGFGIGCRRVTAAGDGHIAGNISSFNGLIDEVAIYGRALSAAELATYVAATR
jgi:hypothetical protein